MTIGLIDVDKYTHKRGKPFPNLALMKLSAWHKAHGDSVEMCFSLKRYDRIYASKVFTFTKDIEFTPQTDDFRRGGTGYFYPDGGESLPPEVEHVMPDYSLYGITDTAYGYMSRGCPRGCHFCVVSKKEGRSSIKVADLREFWNGQKKIVLLDPNLTACPDWKDILGQLAESRAYVDITQGVDIRMLNERKVEAINELKLKMIHFAWDGNDDLAPQFEKYAQMWRLRARERRVYCLTNFNTTMEWNLHRIYTIRDLGYDPFVMVYDKPNAPKDILRLQRWCNNKFIFYKCKRFEDYR